MPQQNETKFEVENQRFGEVLVIVGHGANLLHRELQRSRSIRLLKRNQRRSSLYREDDDPRLPAKIALNQSTQSEDRIVARPAVVEPKGQMLWRPLMMLSPFVTVSIWMTKIPI